MFTGLSAFPLTPIAGGVVDERRFSGLVDRLVEARVDSITVLGSTGSYAYLTLDERMRVAALGLKRAVDVPMLVGISALPTPQVLRLAEHAQTSGAAGVLLAPMTYQPLSPDEVFGLYNDVTAELSVPLVVYDNPGTTRFTFSDDLHAAIARLPGVASIKIPAVPRDVGEAAARVRRLRDLLPEHVTIGISGDASAAVGLGAGCDTWYSVIGGTLPQVALEITRAAQAGDAAGAARALAMSARLEPLWDLFAEYGSLRVTAAIAELLGLVDGPCLPRPIRGLDVEARARVAEVLASMAIA